MRTKSQLTEQRDELQTTLANLNKTQSPAYPGGKNGFAG